MNTIKLSPYPGFGVKTEVNGVELQDVCDIKLICPIDGRPMLYVEQLIGPGLDVTLEGDVQPILNFNDPTLDLHVETIGNRTRYWVTEKK